MPLPARDIKLYRIPRGATKKHHAGSYRHVQAIKFHCAVLRASVSRTDEAIVVAQTFMGILSAASHPLALQPTPWAHKCSGQTPILWPNGSETTWARCRCRFPFPARLNLCANLATASAEVAEATPIDGPMCLSGPLRKKENSNNGKISDYDHIPMSRIAMANARIHVNYITPLMSRR